MNSIWRLLTLLISAVVIACPLSAVQAKLHLLSGRQDLLQDAAQVQKDRLSRKDSAICLDHQ